MSDEKRHIQELREILEDMTIADYIWDAWFDAIFDAACIELKRAESHRWRPVPFLEAARDLANGMESSHVRDPNEELPEIIQRLKSLILEIEREEKLIELGI
jgi:hypothetical protein